MAFSFSEWRQYTGQIGPVPSSRVTRKTPGYIVEYPCISHKKGPGLMVGGEQSGRESLVMLGRRADLEAPGNVISWLNVCFEVKQS